MRTSTFLALAAIFAAACTTEQPADTNDQGTDSSTGTDTDTDTGTATEAPVYMSPAAVGFEYDGGLDADGNLVSYMSQGTEVPPGFLLTFADEVYFGMTTAEEQAGHFCTAWGTFQPAIADTPLTTHDGADVYISYDAAFSITGWDCDTLLDPAEWGADGADLAAVFQGIHLGMAFAPMTTYLADAYDPADYETYGKYMFAEYIAINDADGTFDGDDWTTGRLFEWDTTTHELLADADDYLIPIDLTGMQLGANLPEGYIRSSAYWYQDFPLMDFTNLTDGAPM